VIATLLSDGIWALRDARGAGIARHARGLERAEFTNCMVVGGVVTVIGIMAPEISGLSAVIDRSLGDEPSSVMLVWPMLPAIAAAVGAMTALLIWKGPNMTDWLARRFGGQSSLMSAALWLYLATAAAIVITLGLASFDLVAGFLASYLPDGLGIISLVVSLGSLIVSLAICGVLAQSLLDVKGSTRSLIFSAVWLIGCLVAAAAVWAPVYSILGGTLS
jgi:hypothetical protein